MFNVRFFILLLFMSLVFGCKGGLAMHDLLPIPIPKFEEEIYSVEYVNSKYNIDCSSLDHSMNDEIARARNSAALTNKLISGVKIGGKSVTVDPIDDVYHKSKRIGNNHYHLECAPEQNMEVQVSEATCWAACTQYLIASRYGKYISQEEIVGKVKKGTDISSAMAAGDVMDILRGLGFMGFEYTQNGADHVLQSLAFGQPVMIGLMPEKQGDPGHAVIIRGARYSFVRTANVFCFTCPKYAFTEFIVLDPADGSERIAQAKEFDGRIYFVISYLIHET